MITHVNEKNEIIATIVDVVDLIARIGASTAEIIAPVNMLHCGNVNLQVDITNLHKKNDRFMSIALKLIQFLVRIEFFYWSKVDRAPEADFPFLCAKTTL